MANYLLDTNHPSLLVKHPLRERILERQIK